MRNWLREQLTLEGAEAHYAALEQATLALMGTTGGWLPYFRERIVAEMQPGDELWFYDTGPAAWANLHGEKGIALVRAGCVVGLIMECRD